jgi:predicted AlkP superfamily phosphohydrolase/phosphomutase
MDGGICVNEWLQKHGYLSLKSDPKKITPCKPEMIDWENTRAWGEGGYYGRIFINLAGREPLGIVSLDEYESVRGELKEHLEAIVDESGEKINTRVFKPEEVYRECNSIPPDLIVYFGDLYWRSVGSVGYNSIYTYENDTGPDDCNHAEMGMFIFKNGKRTDGYVPKQNLYDIAPTILKEFEMDIPEEMQGEPI